MSIVMSSHLFVPFSGTSMFFNFSDFFPAFDFFINHGFGGITFLGFSSLSSILVSSLFAFLFTSPIDSDACVSLPDFFSENQG